MDRREYRYVGEGRLWVRAFQAGIIVEDERHEYLFPGPPDLFLLSALLHDATVDGWGFAPQRGQELIWRLGREHQRGAAVRPLLAPRCVWDRLREDLLARVVYGGHCPPGQVVTDRLAPASDMRSLVDHLMRPRSR